MTILRMSDYGGESAATLRVPPHSLEAEQSVLGGLLLDNAAWDRAGDLLVAADFYRHEHRAIFGAIGTLIEASKPADVITVHEQLLRVGADESADLPYLDSLAASVPTSANMRAYAEIVREHSARRALISAVTAASEIAWNGAGSTAELLDQVGSSIATLEKRATSREPRELGSLILERLDHYAALGQGETIAGIPTDIAVLDRSLGGGLKPGNLVVLGARPTVGKTSLAGQITASVATKGHVALLLSQEMSGGDLVDRFIANEAGVQLGSLTSGGLTDADWSAVTRAAEQLQARRVFVDDTPALTLHQIRAKARQVRRKHGLALVVVDYLQLCSAASSNDRRHHQIEATSRGLKQLAKELDVCVLLLSQLNRASTERGEPEMSDLKESGAIEEDADVVLLLHPMGNEPDRTLLMLLKVAKNRQGRRGRIALSFDGKTQRWTESVGNVERRTRA